MIKFFRNIRQKLIKEGKTANYLKYAIGEIVLVVIGILIALQINNWNENRRQHDSMKIALGSYVEDLEQDSVQLTQEIQAISTDLERLNGIRDRLSKPTATMDTLKHIARYDYIPFFNPTNELNRNTILTLLSTGNIDYFEVELKTKILQLNSAQLRALKNMDETISIFLNSQYNNNFLIQGESADVLSSATIKGPLLEKYWSDLDDKELLNSMLSKISVKILMNKFNLAAKMNLLDKTNDLLLFIHNSNLKE